MGQPGSSCSQVPAMCSFPITLLEVNASCSQRLSNKSFTWALAPQTRKKRTMVRVYFTFPHLKTPCHHTHGAEEDDSSEEPLAAWKSCPSRWRQGVWERSLCEAVRLMTHSRLCHILSVRRPDRKTASAQSPERSRALDLDGLPSSGT